jgi:SAM-dependent methyltransferase
VNSKPAAQMNPSFWDERYQKGRFMFSTKPNAFLVEQVPEKGGKALAVGDGEGRNGVWLAEQGWSVTSLDYSQEGIAKTQQLATQRGVALETICADASQWDYPEAHFDLIVLFYFHLPREPAKVAHRGCLKALKPGGRLILEGFRKEQMPLLSGGPRVEDWMYSAEEINEDFGMLDARINRAVGRVLREGRLHGSAAIYQYVGQKAD